MTLIFKDGDKDVKCSCEQAKPGSIKMLTKLGKTDRSNGKNREENDTNVRYVLPQAHSLKKRTETIYRYILYTHILYYTYRNNREQIILVDSSLGCASYNALVKWQ